MRKRRLSKAIRLLFILMALLSCTHEYIPEVANKWQIQVDLSFVDPEYWPEGQQVRIGVFDPADEKTPVESMLVNQPEDGTVSLGLNEVLEGEYRLLLYLSENGIYKVTLDDLGLILVNADQQVEADPFQLLTYQRVQRQVFNRCQLCHGGSSGDMAAGLNLTSGNSYNSLINVQAQNDPSMVRVLPASAENSYLIRVLNKQIGFNHAPSSSATAGDIQLIVDWINDGAKND